MPRLVNKVTGAVVSVSESTAARLGSEWAPADQPVTEPKKETSRRSRKSSAE